MQKSFASTHITKLVCGAAAAALGCATGSTSFLDLTISPDDTPGHPCPSTHHHHHHPQFSLLQFHPYPLSPSALWFIYPGIQPIPPPTWNNLHPGHQLQATGIAFFGLYRFFLSPAHLDADPTVSPAGAAATAPTTSSEPDPTTSPSWSWLSDWDFNFDFDSILASSLSGVTINGLSVTQWQSGFKHMFPPELIPDFNVNQIKALTLIAFSDHLVDTMVAAGLVQRQEKLVRAQTLGNIRQPQGIHAWTLKNKNHNNNNNNNLFVTNTEQGSSLTLNKAFMNEALYYAHLSDIIYENTFEEFITNTMIKPELCSLVNLQPEFDNKHNVWTPAYILAVDDEKKKITLIIRGTKEYSDAIIDICGNPSQFINKWNKNYNKNGPPEQDNMWKAHGGLGSSAVAVYEKVKKPLKELIKANKGYDLVFTGHSLGGGTAVLLSIMMNLDPDMKGYATDRHLQTYAFCPPPTVNDTLLESLGNSSSDRIYNFVHQDDVVPRLSISNIQKLSKALERFYQDIDIVEITKNNLAIVKALIDHDKQEKEKERAKQIEKGKDTSPSARQEPALSPVTTTSWSTWFSSLTNQTPNSTASSGATGTADPKIQAELNRLYLSGLSVAETFNQAYVQVIEEMEAQAQAQASAGLTATEPQLVIAEDLHHAGHVIFMQSFKHWEKSVPGGDRIKTALLRPDSRELHSIVVSGDMIVHHLCSSVLPVIREIYKYSKK